MIWLVLGTVLPSLTVSWFAGVWIRRRAAAWGLLDRPGGHKGHREPVALGGGIAIWLGVVFPLLTACVVVAFARYGVVSTSILPQILLTHADGIASMAGKLAIVLTCATALTALGLADDRWQLDWRVRLSVQLAIALFMVTQGWQMTLFIESPWLTGTLSVIWIAGLINSFNMLDNMDGLSAGVAAIAAAMLAGVMLLAPGEPQLFVAGLLLVVTGSLGGFLIHNRYPARLYMGDAGSYFVGFMIAIATLAATFAGPETRRHALLAPLCVLAIPLYDTISVVLIRMRERRSPFQGDRSHFSHRLVKLGMSPPQAVRTIYLATIACGLGAFLLYQVDLTGAAIVLSMVIAVLLIVARLEWVASLRKRKDE